MACGFSIIILIYEYKTYSYIYVSSVTEFYQLVELDSLKTQCLGKKVINYSSEYCEKSSVSWRKIAYFPETL